MEDLGELSPAERALVARLRQEGGQGNRRDTGVGNDGAQAQGEVGRVRGADHGVGEGGGGGAEGGGEEWEEDAFGLKDEYGDLRNIFAAQVSDDDDLLARTGKAPVGFLRVRPLKG